MALCPGLPAGRADTMYQKDKTSLDLLEQEMVSDNSIS